MTAGTYSLKVINWDDEQELAQFSVATYGVKEVTFVDKLVQLQSEVVAVQQNSSDSVEFKSFENEKIKTASVYNRE